MGKATIRDPSGRLYMFVCENSGNPLQGLPGEVDGLQVAQPEQELPCGILQCRLGALEDTAVTRDRRVMAAIRSTKPAPPRMKWSNDKLPIMIEVPSTRIPGEPVAVMPHAGSCEGRRRATDVLP